MIQCAVWWSVPLSDPAEYLGLLTDAERDRHAAFRQDADRSRFGTGRMLARAVAARYLHADPADVVLDATCSDCDRKHGPPRIPGSTLALSISHSGDRVGLAVADGVELGLDVETAQTERVDDGMLNYALSARERAAVAGLPDPARAEAFYRYWTCKEALMKATGRGLRIPLGNLGLSDPGEPLALVSSAEPALSPQHTRLAALEPGPGYHAAVAVLTAHEVHVTQRWWATPSAGVPAPNGQRDGP